MTTKNDKRQARINIRLSEAMYSRLEAIAEDMGLATSTLSAVAIAEYVTTKERTLKATRQAVALQSKSAMEVMEKQLSDLLPLVLEQASSDDAKD